MGITRVRVIWWACRVNCPSVVINSSENKDRMLIERIRIAAFFHIRLSYRRVLFVGFRSLFSLELLTKPHSAVVFVCCVLPYSLSTLSLVHGCLLSCLVLSCLVFCLLSYLGLSCLSPLFIRLKKSRSNEHASVLFAHGAVTVCMTITVKYRKRGVAVVSTVSTWTFTRPKP
jgi:hypothetical protein